MSLVKRWAGARRGRHSAPRPRHGNGARNAFEARRGARGKDRRCLSNGPVHTCLSNKATSLNRFPAREREIDASVVILTCENRYHARALQRKVKARMKEVRNENWNDLMVEVTPRYKAYWELAKALKTEGAVSTPALKRPDKSIAFDEREKAECLADSIEHQCTENPPLTTWNMLSGWKKKFVRESPFRQNLNPIMHDEVSKYIKDLKIRKAPAWKKAVVISIPEPEKPCNLPTNYRPISLLSVLEYISEGFKIKRKTVAVFFDVTKAFNRLNNIYSSIRPIKAGVPKGHTLSTAILRLYSVYVSDIPRPPTGVQLALFADDIALYVRFANAISSQRKQRILLNSLRDKNNKQIELLSAAMYPCKHHKEIRQRGPGGGNKLNHIKRRTRRLPYRAGRGPPRCPPAPLAANPVVRSIRLIEGTFDNYTSPSSTFIHPFQMAQSPHHTFFYSTPYFFLQKPQRSLTSLVLQLSFNIRLWRFNGTRNHKIPLVTREEAAVQSIFDKGYVAKRSIVMWTIFRNVCAKFILFTALYRIKSRTTQTYRYRVQSSRRSR
ncbi:hypothetical protein EVAR_27094_1 [Eumeta japonica]|uniref:RNA-directed DNA polymerase from transposon BS n=1 Tax=Eumeta variegata TaxID=151549 RepID=A0A4C1VMK6_EUMVA|nr:hypothetical protein EVAR_27094_1 [Eumeta japonica]